MNRREAKHEAYFHAAVMLRTAIEGAGEDSILCDYSERDRDLIAVELESVVSQLEQRAIAPKGKR